MAPPATSDGTERPACRRRHYFGSRPLVVHRDGTRCPATESAWPPVEEDFPVEHVADRRATHKEAR